MSKVKKIVAGIILVLLIGGLIAAASIFHYSYLKRDISDAATYDIKDITINTKGNGNAAYRLNDPEEQLEEQSDNPEYDTDRNNSMELENLLNELVQEIKNE